MKKRLLLAISAFATVGLMAQQNAGNVANKANVARTVKAADKAVKVKTADIHRTDYSYAPVKQGNPTVGNSVQSQGPEITIGKTVYDLQTNSSVQNRIMFHGDNQVSAIWTMGFTDPSFPERGTGFNFRQTDNVWKVSVENDERIEDVRTGFPSLDRIQNKGDIVLAHNVDGNLQLTTNDNIGDTDSWVSVETPLDSTFWNRMKVANGQTVHVVSVTTPTTGTPAGVPFQGMDGALVYSRSSNGGQTWEVQKQLFPGVDGTKFAGFGGDSYAIDIKGNTIAIACGGFRHEAFLLKSTDNGATWSKTTMLPYFVDRFEDQLTDVNNDGIADTIDVSDGSMALVIDNNDLVHVFWGNMRILNDDTTDDQISYFPGTNGIVYWNENSLQPEVIAGAEDFDGDGALLSEVAVLPVYQLGLTSMPSIGIDASNNLYLTYSAVKETTNDGADAVYRRIYGIYSGDNGDTWTDPRTIADFDEFGEYVYCSVARNVTDSVRMIYQRDFTPGIAVSPQDNNPHPYGENDIVYLAVGSQYFVTSTTEVAALNNDVVVYPNPANGNTKVSFSLNNAQNVNVSIVNVLGQTIANTAANKLGAGKNTVELNLDGIAPGIYSVLVKAGNSTSSQKLVIK